MRPLVVVPTTIVLLVGLLFVVSPLARGLGVTVGALVGVVLVLVAASRLAQERRRSRRVPPARG
jgi:ABC-type phosphate transport system permease subunit